jgi:FkbM family methyltransferase
MTGRDFRRFFIILLKALTIGVALLTIPIILLVSVLWPWRGTLSLLFFILPWSLLVLWVVRRILCGGPLRKESRISFIATVIAGALFWVMVGGTAASFLLKKSNTYLMRMTPKKMIALTTDILNDVVKIKNQERRGLFSNKTRERQLLRNYARFYAAIFYPFLANPDDIRILNYHVKGFDFFDTAVLFQEIYIYQQYFFQTSEAAPWIIDCGSHIGLSILYFKALYPEARVLGFEPAPGTFQVLSENVKNNRLKHIRLENKAVSNEEGKLAFYGDRSKTSTLIKERGTGESAEVDVVRLSKYIDRKVSFLKLDVEGAEELVLNDLAAADKLRMIQQMIVEYHHHFTGDSDRLSRFLKILEDHNFGYQIEGSSESPYTRMEEENIMIFAYQK